MPKSKNSDAPQINRGIAFYAPLKSPLHPIPSGDRKIAQLFFRALQQGGFEVELASQLRSFEKNGNIHKQQRFIELATKEAARILRRWRKINFKPTAWFSYHLYYKAPDLIGPIICRALNIPYLIAEASWAEKRATGAWALYHAKVDDALQLASKVICINPVDQIALDKYYEDRLHSPIVPIKAFIDNDAQSTNFSLNLPVLPQDKPQQKPSRKAIADQYSLDQSVPWLISIAMMRKGDKFKSYQLLSSVIHNIDTPFQLLIIGDGEMQQQVMGLFSQNHNVHFAGALDNQQIRELLPHFEILVWPAINEALGMVFLEAQQTGLAIVAGDEGGVSSIVEHQKTGILTSATDSLAMAGAVSLLLQTPDSLRAMQHNAKQRVLSQHSLNTAAKNLATLIIQTQQEFR